jgi:hypothetical protein
MSNSSHKQRRSRTFHAEVLEPRALLSTSGLVSRPAHAVAPLARLAVSQSHVDVELGKDPEFSGTFKGTGLLVQDSVIINSSGTVKQLGTGKSGFNGGVVYSNNGGFLKVTGGSVILANLKFNNHMHNTDLTLKPSSGTGLEHGGKISFNNVRGSVTGEFKDRQVITGTFAAHGNIVGAARKLTIHVTVEVTTA